MKRRDFLKHLSQLSLATTAPIISVSSMAQSAAGDYKALVYILLDGGNDAFNTFIPLDEKARSDYESARGALAVSSADLSDRLRLGSDGRLILGRGLANPYSVDNVGLKEPPSQAYLHGSYHIPAAGLGVNAMMPEVAQLMRDGELVVLGNVGTLVEPVAKEGTQTTRLPAYLFSHNSQKMLQDSGQAHTVATTGWAGRLLDVWQGASGPLLGGNISFSGATHAMVGQASAALSLSVTPRVYFSDRTQALQRSLADLRSGSALHQHIRAYQANSFILQNELKTIWSSGNPYAGVTDAYGLPLFNTDCFEREVIGYEGDARFKLVLQLEAVAKVIAYASTTGVKRQVFFVRMGGFDSHGNQDEDHAVNLRGLSIAIDQFQRAMRHLGISEQVTGFTLSDFGRTVGNNGDGTDHGWAGHNMVFGGAINPGAQGGLYGRMPDLSLDGPDDWGDGHIIPDTSVDQQMATLIKWFGVTDATDMTKILPNINNFTSRDLGFLTHA